MSNNCSGAASGASDLATTLYLSDLIHPGPPDISKLFAWYASSIRVSKVTFVATNLPPIGGLTMVLPLTEISGRSRPPRRWGVFRERPATERAPVVSGRRITPRKPRANGFLGEESRLPYFFIIICWAGARLRRVRRVRMGRAGGTACPTTEFKRSLYGGYSSVARGRRRLLCRRGRRRSRLRARRAGPSSRSASSSPLRLRCPSFSNFIARRGEDANDFAGHRRGEGDAAVRFRRAAAWLPPLGRRTIRSDQDLSPATRTSEERPSIRIDQTPGSTSITEGIIAVAPHDVNGASARPLRLARDQRASIASGPLPGRFPVAPRGSAAA